jgi:hypothetical protein
MTTDTPIEETMVSSALILNVPFGELSRIKAEIAAIRGVNIVYQKVSIGRLKIIEDNGK